MSRIWRALRRPAAVAVSDTAGPRPAARRFTSRSSSSRSTARTAAGWDSPMARRSSSTVRPGSWAIVTSAAAVAPVWPIAASVSRRIRPATSSTNAPSRF
jgi:hypothetical protein